MLEQINQLHRIAQKNKRTILGLMSGTSLDGLDIALCVFNGTGANTHLIDLKFSTSDYCKSFKDKVKRVFTKSNVDLQELTLINAEVAIEHAKLINQQLQSWGISHTEIDICASHGQTIFHAPQSLHQQFERPNATLQIGDGDHLAKLINIITLSDFRQKHVAHGGEGAPLAKFGDYLLFADQNEHRCLLNIGGIANFTFIPADCQPEHVQCSDIGPGNTLIDAFTSWCFKLDYDANGDIASQGTGHPKLLASLLSDSFFTLNGAKTTGQEYFNLTWLDHHLTQVQLPNLDELKGVNSSITIDILATVTQFSAKTIADSLNQLLTGDEALKVYISGGGVYNNHLIEQIKSNVSSSIRVNATDKLGLNPDAKEAVLFALLANETLAGKGFVAQEENIASDHSRPFSMGKISLP